MVQHHWAPTDCIKKMEEWSHSERGTDGPQDDIANLRWHGSRRQTHTSNCQHQFLNYVESKIWVMNNNLHLSFSCILFSHLSCFSCKKKWQKLDIRKQEVLLSKKTNTFPIGGKMRHINQSKIRSQHVAFGCWGPGEKVVKGGGILVTNNFSVLEISQKNVWEN